MTLRFKTLLVVLITLVAVLGAQRMSSRLILRASFARSERDYAQVQLEGAQRLLSSEVESMENRVLDWAHWDDMWRFIDQQVIQCCREWLDRAPRDAAG